MKRRSVFARISAGLLIIFFCVSVLYPLCCMFRLITAENWSDLWSWSVFRKAWKNTLVLGAAVTAGGLLVSLLMAFLMARTRVKGKIIWQALFLLPMLIPSVSEGTGLVLLLGNNGWLTRLFHWNGSIYGPGGIILGQILYCAPIAFLLFNQALEKEPETAYEAASVLGIPGRNRFFSITLPYLRKEILGAAFLIFTLSVTDYGVPLTVGGKTKTLAVIMYAQVLGQLQFGRGSVIGLLLLIPAVLAFLADTYGRNQANRREEMVRQIRPDRVRDGWALIGCIVLALCYLLPILAFISLMFLEDYPLHMNFTLEHIREYWGIAGRGGLKNSLIMSAGAALFGTAGCSLAAYTGARTKGRASRSVHLFSIMTVCVPGLVLGLSYLLAFSRTPLCGTYGILILAGTIHFFSTPYLMLYQSFLKCNPALEDAAANLGIPVSRLFFRILLPQCREALIDMAVYFFVNSMISISAVSFLADSAHRPLSMLVTQYNSQINWEAAAFLSFLILAVNLGVRTGGYLLRHRTGPAGREPYRAGH